MKQRKFTKSSLHRGKYLCLHVGNGDKTINDGEILVGDKYAPFVGMGYLTEVFDKCVEPEPEPESEPEPEPAPEPEAEVKVIKAEAEPDSGTTKSSAHKMLKASKRGGKRRGKK